MNVIQLTGNECDPYLHAPKGGEEDEVHEFSRDRGLPVGCHYDFLEENATRHHFHADSLWLYLKPQVLDVTFPMTYRKAG